MIFEDRTANHFLTENHCKIKNRNLNLYTKNQKNFCPLGDIYYAMQFMTNTNSLVYGFE